MVNLIDELYLYARTCTAGWKVGDVLLALTTCCQLMNAQFSPLTIGIDTQDCIDELLEFKARALTGLEREAWPSVPFNHVEVSMAYPGATPEEVEESIVVKIEDEVIGLEDVKAVKSVAAPRMASVRIEVK